MFRIELHLVVPPYPKWLPSPHPFLCPPVVAFYRTQIVLVSSSQFCSFYVFSLCLSGSCLTTCIIVEIFSKITPTTTTTQMAICGSVIFCPTTTVVFPGRPINTVNVQNCWPTRDILIFALYTRLHTPFSFRVWSALIATLGSTRRHWQLKN